MTRDQIVEAIAQMQVQCDLHMPSYDMISARGVLYELGYDEEQTYAVLLTLAEGGFSYCLDHEIACSDGVGGSGTMLYPSRDVCHWGPDQLKSRLDFVSVRS